MKAVSRKLLILVAALALGFLVLFCQYLFRTKEDPSWRSGPDLLSHNAPPSLSSRQQGVEVKAKSLPQIVLHLSYLYGIPVCLEIPDPSRIDDTFSIVGQRTTLGACLEELWKQDGRLRFVVGDRFVNVFYRDSVLEKKVDVNIQNARSFDDLFLQLAERISGRRALNKRVSINVNVHPAPGSPLSLQGRHSIREFLNTAVGLADFRCAWVFHKKSNGEYSLGLVELD